jgi:cell division protein FtsL
MNAAARLVHQHTFSRHLVMTEFLSRQQLFVFTLALGMLLSALSIIYVTHLTRVMYATYQHDLAEEDHLQGIRQQLLLERGTWMMQARIQQIAEKKLGMIIPDHKSVVIIKE